MKNVAHLTKIKTTLSLLAEYFQIQITDAQLKMYTEDLADIAESDLTAAIETIRKSENIIKFPLPSQIRALIYGKMEDNAIELSAKIEMALSKYGYTNPDKAKEFIGEVGWEIVKLNGGWQNMCQTIDVDDLPILKAQWRNLAKSLLNKVNFGVQKEKHIKLLNNINDTDKELN